MILLETSGSRGSVSKYWGLVRGATKHVFFCLIHTEYGRWSFHSVNMRIGWQLGQAAAILYNMGAWKHDESIQ